MTLLNGVNSGAGGGAFNRTTVRAVNGNGTVVSTDGVLDVSAAAGAARITFVPSVANSGQRVQINKTDGTANPVEIFDGTAVQGVLTAPAVGGNVQSTFAVSDGFAITVTQ